MRRASYSHLRHTHLADNVTVSVRPSLLAAVVAFASVILIVLSAAWPGLDVPLSYIDEGYNLALARNLAETGQYAVPVVGEPLHWFDQYVTTGPTMLGPMALAIKLFGASVVPVRAVALLFLILFLASALLAAHGLSRPYGWPGSAVVLVLFGTLSYDLYDLGLRVLGEVPAQAFFFLAIAAASRQRRWGWFLAGVCLGLAVVTKPQVVIGVTASLGVVCALSWHDRHRITEDATPVVAGALLPLTIWNLYQIGVAGMATWQHRTLDFYQTFRTSSGAIRVFDPSTVRTLLAVSAIVLIALGGLSWMARRGPLTASLVLSHLGVIATIVLILLPLLLVRWNHVNERFSAHWSSSSLETAVALAGLVSGTILGLRQRRKVLTMAAASGAWFAAWYFGIAGGVMLRHSVYWRWIGLLLAGVVVVLLWQSWSGKVSRALDAQFGHGTATRLKPFGTLGLAILATGLVVLHSLPLIRADPKRTNIGMTLAARWIQENTPANALLLGSGWWMPWEASYLSGRAVANVTGSALSEADLARPMYLVMPPEWLDFRDLEPEVEAVMRSPEYRLFEVGGDPMMLSEKEFADLGVAVYRWPELHELNAALASVRRVKLDMIAKISSARVDVASSREPRSEESIVRRAVQALRRGIDVIGPATITTELLPIEPDDALLIGIWPPQTGSGVTLRVSTVAETGEAVEIWSEKIPAVPPLPDAYQVRLVSLEDAAGGGLQHVEVAIETAGSTDENRVFFGHLAVVRTKGGPERSMRVRSVAPDQSPIDAARLEQQIALSITGKDFSPEVEVLIDQTPLPTTFQSPTELTGVAPRAMLDQPGEKEIEVRRQGSRSNIVEWSVDRSGSLSATPPAISQAD